MSECFSGLVINGFGTTEMSGIAATGVGMNMNIMHGVLLCDIDVGDGV